MIEKLSEITVFEDKLCCRWTGVAELTFPGQGSRVHHLVAMLPAKKSGDEEVVAHLVDLGAHFQRWLHQDEFGPKRSHQTASLRALTKSLLKLQRQFSRAPSQLKGRLDATLRSRNDPLSPVMQAIYEAVADVEYDLRTARVPNWEAKWFSRFQDCVRTLIAQSQSLDTNTDGKISLVAFRRKFDPSQATGLAFGLEDVESWLNNYWNVLVETLDELNRRRGAEERVSLKLLVELLCELWDRETGCRVTAHGQVKDRYTGQAETTAGRFVTAAVEAMLPDQSWFEEHDKFANSRRAKTFLPGREADRARQILVIMRDFVRRYPKIC